MASFDGIDLKQEDLKSWYYHWFWGLYKIKKEKPAHSINMEQIFHQLKQNKEQQVFVQEQMDALQKQHSIIRFFYWLFNIKNFALNTHKYFLMKKLIKNAVSHEEKNNMQSDQEPLEAKENASLQSRDIVDEVQLILTGRHDHDAFVFFGDWTLCCDNLEKAISAKMLEPYQKLISSTYLLWMDYFNSYPKAWHNYIQDKTHSEIHKAHELLKKYHSRLGRVLMLMRTDLRPLKPKHSLFTDYNNPLSSYALTLRKIELLLIKNLRMMQGKMPWHTELNQLLNGNLISILEEGTLYLLKERPVEEVDLPEEALTVTENRQADLNLLGIQKNYGERVLKTDIIRAYRKIAKVVHPDHGGDTEEFKRLLAAKERLEKKCYYRQPSEYELRKRLEFFWRQQMTHARFLWMSAQDELDKAMDQLQLKTKTRVALWERVLHQRKNYCREGLNAYLEEMDMRVRTIKACTHEIEGILQLKNAVQEQDSVAVNSLLEAGISPDGRLKSLSDLSPCALLERNEPLLMATFLETPDIFHLLMNKNADLFVKNRSGCTVAEQVAVNGFWPVATKKELLDTLSQKGVSLATILYAACLGEQKSVEEQVQLGVRHCVDSHGNTALHYAAANNHLTLCRMLYRNHREWIATKNKEGFTPMDWAVLNQHVLVVSWFLSQGAECTRPIKEEQEESHFLADEFAPAGFSSLPALSENHDPQEMATVPDEKADSTCQSSFGFWGRPSRTYVRQQLNVTNQQPVTPEKESRCIIN